MVTAFGIQLLRTHSPAIHRGARTASAVLAIAISLAGLVAAGPAVSTRSGYAGGTIAYRLTGTNLVQKLWAPGALARGASLTGGFAGRKADPSPAAPSPTARIGVSFRAAGHLTPNDVVATLGTGSDLFGSHPMSPVDGSGPSGSPVPTGVLNPNSTGTVTAAGGERPPLPPYGRRATWTFREPLTRPG